MKNILVLIFICLLMFMSCKSEKGKDKSAKDIMNDTILSEDAIKDSIIKDSLINWVMTDTAWPINLKAIIVKQIKESSNIDPDNITFAHQTRGMEIPNDLLLTTPNPISGDVIITFNPKYSFDVVNTEIEKEVTFDLYYYMEELEKVGTLTTTIKLLKDNKFIITKEHLQKEGKYVIIHQGTNINASFVVKR